MSDLTKMFDGIITLPQEDDVDYKAIIKVIQILAEDVHNYIDLFTDLVDPDKVPEIFLPKLFYLVKYKLNYNIDIDIQREIVKRVVDFYKRRGTDDSIVTAATYASDDLWVGGHTFLPGYDLSLDKASIMYPVDQLFRHCISKYSGVDRYSDASFWRAGILQVSLSYLDDKVRQAIMDVVPAGIRVFYNIDFGSFDLDGNILSYGSYNALNFYHFLLDLKEEQSQKIQAGFFSGGSHTVDKFLSGRQLYYSFNELEVFNNILDVDMSKVIEDVDTFLIAKGLPLFNTSKSILSGLYCISGMKTSIYDDYANNNYRLFLSSVIENMSFISSMLLSGITLDYQYDMEIEQIS